MARQRLGSLFNAGDYPESLRGKCFPWSLIFGFSSPSSLGAGAGALGSVSASVTFSGGDWGWDVSVLAIVRPSLAVRERVGFLGRQPLDLPAKLTAAHTVERHYNLSSAGSRKVFFLVFRLGWPGRPASATGLSMPARRALCRAAHLVRLLPAYAGMTGDHGVVRYRAGIQADVNPLGGARPYCHQTSFPTAFQCFEFCDGNLEKLAAERRRNWDLAARYCKTNLCLPARQFLSNMDKLWNRQVLPKADKRLGRYSRYHRTRDSSCVGRLGEF